MRERAPHVAILTRHDDFHAAVVRHVLAESDVRCSVVLTDSMASVGGLSWASSDGVAQGRVSDAEGREVVVADVDVVWWRRMTGEPRIPARLKDESARALIVNDCRATLLGLFLTDFAGVWISHPEATRTAHNKLVQLRTAQQAGLRVPRTLVSQAPEAVRRFCATPGRRVVVKAVAGSQQTPVMTGLVTPEMLVDEDIRLSPAIYQELVPGERHLRVCCFGSEVHSALLRTETLDWRYPLDAEVEPYELDQDTADKILAVVGNLGLRMGIVDMKLDPDGTPVWLEINPQGQFLFLEGMCSELPLTRIFADFLVREANRAAPKRGRVEV
jgi:hypothetical protein